MSYILDALRKSEAERRQAEPVVPLAETARAVTPPRRDIGAPLTVLAVAAAAAVLAGAWWAFNANLQSPRLAPMAGAAAPSISAAKPEASEPSEVAEAQATPAAPAKTPEPGAPATARAETPPAPELQPSPFASPPRRGSERDLAEEARVDRSPAPSAAAPVVQARAPSQPEAAKPAAPLAPAPVKFLRAMPDEFRSALPPLAVTIHIYAPRAADRILYINNKPYQAGDQVAAGVRLERIVEDGAVLSYHGQRFKLARPS